MAATPAATPLLRSGVPVRLAIAGLVVVGMVLLAAALVAAGWVGSRQVLLETANRTARDAGRLTTEKAGRMIDPASATLRMLAFDPITTATRIEDRLARVGVFSSELAANDLISAIYVGYENGDFLLMRSLERPEVRQMVQAPPRSNYVVQTVTQAADGTRVGEYRFFSSQGRELERRAVPGYQFDPRTRPWYQAARATVDEAISEPYVFFTTRQAGISLSRKARQGGATIGVDMALDDLATSLGDLRLTPGSELALLDTSNRVMAYRDMERVLVQDGEGFGFRKLDALDVPALRRLVQVVPGEDGSAVAYDVQGREWLGMVLPFDVIAGYRMRLLIAAPSDELLSDMEKMRSRMIQIAAVLVLLFLPLGWWAGSAIGRRLEDTARQARRMSRFDFSGQAARPSVLREVNALSEVVDNVSSTVEAFLDISRTLGTEPQVERMLQQVLEKFMRATRCSGGAVYRLQHAARRMVRSAQVGDQGALRDDFAYPEERAVRSGMRDVDADLRQVELELRGRSGRLEGLLVLMHAADQVHADPLFLDFAKRLTGMLAVAIETRELIDSQRALFDAVIRLMADAIDAKSAYTGGHCERVPELATLLADRLAAETEGPYASFRLNEEERYAFHLGAWLHDCGKVTSPEHIVDKATKLEVIHNRIHEVRLRFEVLWRDAEIAHLRRALAGEVDADDTGWLLAAQQELQADFAFVAQCNVGGEFLPDAAITRLRAIATRTWWRHFDASLGLSTEESRRLQAAVQAPPALPVQEPLLADRPEHLVAWGERRPPVERGDPRNHLGFDMQLPAQRQNMGELHNLSIRRGTLTPEDRFAINDHIVQTLVMLKKLPWPEHLRRVPEIAANHHEKMDGQGYPRRLPAGELHLTDRIMALADIFEALTAADRPYKPPKTLSESLRIMARMCGDRHIDTGLFRYFLRSRLWLVYAQKFMAPAQIDDVDVAALEALLPPEQATAEPA